MVEDKKFYWIKLKDDFMSGDTIDFLMGQKNGAEYVVLYQMLCLKTKNTNGELGTQVEKLLLNITMIKYKETVNILALIQ